MTHLVTYSCSSSECASDNVRDSITLNLPGFILYQLTARESIGFGRVENAGGSDAIVRAAKQAGAHDYVDALAGSYETILSRMFDGDSRLSSGQG